jgi:hypothetical protein
MVDWWWNLIPRSPRAAACCVVRRHPCDRNHAGAGCADTGGSSFPGPEASGGTMTACTIPLKHIGDMHILTSDLVNVFKNAEVLRTLDDHQLTAMHSAIGGEISRRKLLGHG